MFGFVTKKKKNLLNTEVNVNNHFHRQLLKNIIQHVLVGCFLLVVGRLFVFICLFVLFSINLESELKKFRCFHCSELVVDQQFKKETHQQS